ncbi:MAG: CCDC90 family protein [Chromatiaceae bacterium]|nr:CCDC90 family protein [Chromatiaceae bacterium]MCF7994744.1 CCDC90 family protein [Chromatiaceae bacterium]MCF8014743.1 CCDC90 family protein [Chromatiaceae bacterium]
MATVTFDTLELVDKLKTAGFAPEQAEAVVRAIGTAQDELVTKANLDQALAPIRTDLTLLKWMMGAVLAGIVSLIIKALL